jgi:tetratricopeptide (TPR) repeat protein
LTFVVRPLLLVSFGLALMLTIRLAVAEVDFRLDPGSALRAPLWIPAAHLAGFESSPEQLHVAVILNPRLSSAWIQLGLNAEADGNLQEAEEDLLGAARIDHLYLPAWTLANFYFRRGDQAKFWPWAERAARLTFDDYHPLLRLADALETSPPRLATRLGGGAPLLRAYLDLLIGAERLDAAQQVADLLAARHDSADRDRLAAFAERLK